MDRELFETLGDAQRLGFLGAAPIELAIERVAPLLAELPESAARCIDVGAGGGLPGLVVARRLPGLQLTLLDRRSRRTDFLVRAVRRLGLADRVEVVNGDAAVFARDPRYRACFDAAFARGLGPPPETAELCRGFVVPGGRLLVTEPPVDPTYDRHQRWPDVGLHRAALRWAAVGDSQVAVLETVGECPPSLPRRVRRPPLW